MDEFGGSYTFEPKYAAVQGTKSQLFETKEKAIEFIIANNYKTVLYRLKNGKKFSPVLASEEV